MDPADRAFAAVEILVHVPDLGGDDEEGHRRDDDVDDEADDAADAVAGIALDLLVGLVDPIEPIDPDRQDEPEDREANGSGSRRSAPVPPPSLPVSPSLLDDLTRLGLL